MSRKKIFLSYAREDKPRAKALVQRLERDGFDVWWDTDLHAGQDFRSEIRRNIGLADFMVVLWSHDSVTSHFVMDEAGEGQRAGKLVPVKIDPVDLPFGFGGLHTVDYDESDASYGALRRAFGVQADEGPSEDVAPAPAPTPETGGQRPPAKRKAWKWVLGVICVSVVAGVGTLIVLQADAESKERAYQEALERYERAVGDYKDNVRACIDTVMEQTQIKQTFSRNASARCPGGGCFGRSSSCNKRESTVEFEAPKGYYIDSYEVKEGAMNDGTAFAPLVEYSLNGDQIKRISFTVMCDPDDGIGAGGGWANATLSGVLRYADEAGLKRKAFAQCQEKFPPPKEPVR